MRMVLFGGGYKGSVILQKLFELREDVVGVFCFDEDSHEKVWYEKVQHIAERRGVPSFNIGSGYKSDVTQILRDIKPEVVFVVGWRYKISKEQYSIPQKGCIVFHDSLLPKYRGFAPMNWAIINGEKATGATMFYIDDEIDNGDIIAQKRVDISIMDTANILEVKVTNLYAELLEENLPLIASGKVKRIPQDHSQATYTCKRIPEDGLIDWSKSAQQIYNLVRGLTAPYPGAYTFIKVDSQVEKIYVWSATLVEEKKNYVGCVPGRVIEILEGEGVKVLTGDGVLVLEDVEMGGYRGWIKADRVIRSIKITLGGQ